ncbi:MAG: two-component system, NtrC family, sensor kinase [Acidobacteriota bacterium]|jgi:signal transduction histidine kinase|nr:two-component system, NtrC family, sensor kinase [Acidobacteriota bacterium]
MHPLKLHTKTTLLACAITLAVLGVVLALVSMRVAEHIREEQKALAELQAVSLAEHISELPEPRDPQALARSATLAHGVRPDAVTVRVWERVGGVFVPVVASSDSAPVEDIPEDAKEVLRGGLATRSVSAQPVGANDSLYRVFAPITENGRVSGAVEVIEKLDDAPAIAFRYGRGAIWIALIAVALITLGVYLLFRYLVYRPVEHLLNAMSRAKAGDLKAQAPIMAEDELGVLSREYNDLTARLLEMTEEREAQKQLLQERVREATLELAERNTQLEETNLELWQTTRRLTTLERLAAAGQTAAQFAHEVGTPLNLISGHVQLLHMNLRQDPEAAQARLETINMQIERIERIVRGMLDRTRPEAPALVPLDLNSLLSRTFDVTAPALESRGVRLVTSLEPQLPLIKGDADRLQQAFINLFNNALDAMAEGGELRVRTFSESLETDDGAHYSSVEFADTGCGMTPEVQARIFDPLYTTKERGRGTGLGLVVVSQVVSDHCGHVEVVSEPGGGARFVLRFPVAPDGLTGAAISEDLVESVESS